jgi:predicted nucleotidyltransferase component of viral defense system
MREDVFVLKGGTAINFFWRDYLRLSVDIDLTYLKIQDRDLSLLISVIGLQVSKGEFKEYSLEYILLKS